MLALVIILLIVAIIELIICFALHFRRLETLTAYNLMADMISEEGEALNRALEELIENNISAKPGKDVAALREILRFVESFNATVRKHSRYIRGTEQKKWYSYITDVLKYKDTEEEHKPEPVKVEHELKKTASQKEAVQEEKPSYVEKTGVERASTFKEEETDEETDTEPTLSPPDE